MQSRMAVKEITRAMGAMQTSSIPTQKLMIRETRVDGILTQELTMV